MLQVGATGIRGEKEEEEGGGGGGGESVVRLKSQCLWVVKKQNLASHACSTIHS
jgi:hypothetical protein